MTVWKNFKNDSSFCFLISAMQSCVIIIKNNNMPCIRTAYCCHYFLNWYFSYHSCFVNDPYRSFCLEYWSRPYDKKNNRNRIEKKTNKKEVDWTSVRYSSCLIGFFKIKHQTPTRKKESQGPFIDSEQIK
jgi:hypothetical protein